jgi:hypothetical protein
VSVVVSMLAVGAPFAAAQLPPLPSRPGVPAPVADVVAQVADQTAPVVIPPAVDATEAAKPGANAVGVALRPGCVYGSTAATVAFGLSGLPLAAPTFMAPVVPLCSAAFNEGPVDPVFYTLDDAVGPQFTGATEPVLDTVNDTAIQPARPQMSGACLLLALVGPAPVPPPPGRVNALHELCFRE